MTEKRIRSGPDIVKEFIDSLKTNKSLDKGTVDAIELLHKEDKLTLTKFQQALESERKESEKHG